MGKLAMNPMEAKRKRGENEKGLMGINNAVGTLSSTSMERNQGQLLESKIDNVDSEPVDNSEHEHFSLGILSSWGSRVRAQAQMAASAVASSQMAASAVATAQSAASAVVTSQMAASAVATAQSAASAVATSQMAASAVATAQNAASAVATSQMAASAIATTHSAVSAVATAASEANERRVARVAADQKRESDAKSSTKNSDAQKLQCRLFLQPSFDKFELLTSVPTKLTTSTVVVVRLSEVKACPVRGYSFQWFRSISECVKVDSSFQGPAGLDGGAHQATHSEWTILHGATYAAYQPTATDVGYRLKCHVTIEREHEKNEGEQELTGTMVEKEYAFCETGCVVADIHLFNSARQALVRGVQFGSLVGRGNAKGCIFKIQIDIVIIDKKRVSSTTISRVSGKTTEPLHARPILSMSAESDSRNQKCFDLIFPRGPPILGGLIEDFVTHDGRLEVEASNRMMRESLLLTLGIANFKGKPTDLTNSNVLFERIEADMAPSAVAVKAEHPIAESSDILAPQGAKSNNLPERKAHDSVEFERPIPDKGIKEKLTQEQAEKALLQHLNLNPFIATETAKLDQTAVSNLADIHEVIFRARYILPTFISHEKMYPLTVLCLLGAPIPLLDKVYTIFPDAAAEAIKFVHAYPMNVVKLLVESRPNILSQKDEHGHIPLHRAASIERFALDKLEYLVHKEPSTLHMQSSQGGSTALHLACRYKLALKKVRLLVDQHDEIFKIKTTVGFTPLHTACYYDSSPQVVKFLLKKWKDAAKEVDGRGRTPLDVYFAKDHRTMKTIELLISANPTPLETNPMDPLSLEELEKYSPHSDGQRLSRPARST